MKFIFLYIGFNKRFDSRGMGPFIATTALFLLFHTEFVLTACSSGCTSCNGSTCKNCEPSYYLASNNCYPCPENCLSCTYQDNCTRCKSNKWGTGVSQCIQDCSKDCLNGECHDETGYCLNCEHGKYGGRCQHNCSVCQNDLCDVNRCTEGCKSGYLEYQTSNDYLCQRCPLKCKQCDSGNVCRICNNGFYLNKFYLGAAMYVNCYSCPNQVDECSNICHITGCKVCKVNNNIPTCADCLEGEIFNGVSCEKQSAQCSQECSTNCDNNGICLGNCNDGWTGERCAEKCNEKCLVCSKNDRNICIQCNGNFYTNDCSLVCSNSCKLEEDKSTCTFANGYCLNGCEQNYWGDTCNYICPEGCQDHDCHRSNGICTGGCKDGKTGDKCETTTYQEETPVTIETTSTSMKATSNTTTTFTPNQASENKVIFTVIGFFSGIGFSLVIVALVTLLYYMRRRYLANKTAQNDSRNVEIPTYTETTNNYESLSHNRTMDTVYSDLGTTE